MQPAKPDEDTVEPLCASNADLYDHHGTAILAYVRLRAASWEDAEDVALEAFMAALEQDNLAGLSENAQLAWLRRVAHNKLVDRYRRVLRHPNIALENAEVTQFSDHTLNPEYITLQREGREQLQQSIAGLPDMQRQVLHLRYGVGLSFAEIALLLNKREAAVRKVLSRALKFLRSDYEQQR